MARHAVTPSTLGKMLNVAKGGDTLSLAPGEYPKGYLSTGYDKPVTLQAADPASPPRFTETLTIRGVKNLVLKGLDYDLTAVTSQSAQGVRCYSAEGLVIQGGRLYGKAPAEGALRMGIGMMLANIKGLRIAGLVSRDLHTAITLSACEDVEIVDNDFEDLRVDAVQFSGLTRALIARNRMERWHSNATDHADAIQGFHLKGAKPSADVRILDNLINCGRNRMGWAQGVFITADETLRIQRVEIAGNTLINTAWNGIMVAGGDDISVHDNRIMFLGYERPGKGEPGPPTESRFRFESVTGLKLTTNSGSEAILPKGVSAAGVARTRTTAAQVQAAYGAWMAKYRRPGGRAEAYGDRKAAFDEPYPQMAAATLMLRLGEA